MTDATAITTTSSSEYDTTTAVTIYCRQETQSERYFRLSSIAAESARVCFEADGMYLTGLAMAEIADVLAETSELHAALERFA